MVNYNTFKDVIQNLIWSLTIEKATWPQYRAGPRKPLMGQAFTL